MQSKAKPIARVRVNLHDEKTVENWFRKYQAKLDERDIRSGSRIYNFDETGVRVGCPGGEEILVPVHVKDLYTPSPENRKSVSIIEAICADGSEPPPPVIIVPAKNHMVDWYNGNLQGKFTLLYFLVLQY